MKNPLQWLLGITLCIYIQVFSFDFVNLDDPSHLDNNPYFSPLTVSNYLHFWQEPHFLYMPVTFSVWSLGVLASPEHAESPRSISGVPSHFRFSAPVFHLFTLFFHLISVLFVFYCLTLFTKDSLICFLGALFFAIHPLQAEPVSWISALKDTLSGAFFFAAFYFFFEKPFSYLALGLYALALMSKPSVVVFSPIVFIVATYFFKSAKLQTLKRLVPFILLTLPILWMTASMQATETLHFQVPDFFGKCLVALDTIAFYIKKTVWPFDLAVDYGRTPMYALKETSIYWTCLFVLFTIPTLFYFLKIKNRRYEILGLVFSLLCIIPVLGFKPFSFQTTSTVSDRFMYLALFGVAIALIPAFEYCLKSRERQIFLSVLFLFLALRTVDQTSHWRNTLTMFGQAIEVNPRSWLSYNNLGSFYEKSNEFEKSLFHYRKAASLDPKQGIFYNNIGSVCLMIRDFICARDAYQTAVDINPLSSLDQNGLGFAYLNLGDKPKARAAFEAAVRLNPALQQSQMGLDLSAKNP